MKSKLTSVRKANHWERCVDFYDPRYRGEYRDYGHDPESLSNPDLFIRFAVPREYHNDQDYWCVVDDKYEANISCEAGMLTVNLLNTSETYWSAAAIMVEYIVQDGGVYDGLRNVSRIYIRE